MPRPSLRTILRALRPSTKRDTESAPPAARNRTCLDVRAPESLSAGIVVGALVLPAEAAVAFARRLPPVEVLAGSSEADAALVGRLREAGADAVAGPGGISAWRDAGWPIREPAWKSPLPPGRAVRLVPTEASARGWESAAGWVQDVRWVGWEFRYDVLVARPAALERLEGLAEEELESAGPRGAAGLGEVV